MKSLEDEILDVGCGHLPTTTKFGHKKRGTIGVDIRRGKADIIADAQFLPLKDDSFNKVISYFMIEHVLDVKKAIYEMVRVSKKRVIIVTDNALFYRVQLLRLLGNKHSYSQREHVHAFFPFHLEHFLERAGIKDSVKKCVVKSCNVSPLHKLDKIVLSLSRLIPNLRPLVKRDILVYIEKIGNENE